MPRITVVSAAVAASLVFAGRGAVSHATAAESLGTGSKAAAAEHCAVEVRAVGERAAPSTPVCFTEPEGVEQYLDAIGTADASGRAVAAASTALGTVYSNSNGGGSSLTFWGSSGCYGVVFGFSSMPSGWSSNVSSAGRLQRVLGDPLRLDGVRRIALELHAVVRRDRRSQRSGEVDRVPPDRHLRLVVEGASPSAAQIDAFDDGTTAAVPSAMTQACNSSGTRPGGLLAAVGSNASSNTPCSHMSVQSPTASATRPAPLGEAIVADEPG